MTQPLGGCPGCACDEAFEQVHPGRHSGDQCQDVSGECPEWVCPACGAGVFMGTVITGTSAVAAGRRTTAPARASARAA
jgi:hypothetical protein